MLEVLVVVKILRSRPLARSLPLDDRKRGVIQSEAKDLGFLGKHLHFFIINSRICGRKYLRGGAIPFRRGKSGTGVVKILRSLPCPLNDIKKLMRPPVINTSRIGDNYQEPSLIITDRSSIQNNN
ncbi:MAG: hypothetical protein WAO23_07610 [Dethiobacteria bacterium]